MINKLSRYSMGVTAAIITSLGLIAGLTQGSSMRKETIAGLLIIAVADNISDSLGIHIYKESEGAKKKEIANATFGNFTVRFVLVLSFILIVFFAPAVWALIISSIWGLALLVALSLSVAKVKKTPITKEVLWHIAVALLVIFGSRFLGQLIYSYIP